MPFTYSFTHKSSFTASTIRRCSSMLGSSVSRSPNSRGSVLSSRDFLTLSLSVALPVRNSGLTLPLSVALSLCYCCLTLSLCDSCLALTLTLILGPPLTITLLVLPSRRNGLFLVSSGDLSTILSGLLCSVAFFMDFRSSLLIISVIAIFYLHTISVLIVLCEASA